VEQQQLGSEQWVEQRLEQWAGQRLGKPVWKVVTNVVKQLTRVMRFERGKRVKKLSNQIKKLAHEI
jgi:hypothetical protein